MKTFNFGMAAGGLLGKFGNWLGAANFVLIMYFVIVDGIKESWREGNETYHGLLGVAAIWGIYRLVKWNPTFLPKDNEPRTISRDIEREKSALN